MILDNWAYENLKNSSLKGYFNFFQNIDYSSTSLEELTTFFTNKPFTDKKPYLFRRELIPKDSRFSKVELVFNNQNKIEAIVWGVNIRLNDLIDFFGFFEFATEPYSETTVFTFRSVNPQIEIIKTRYSGFLYQEKDLGFRDQQNAKIINPTFEFIQFNIRGRVSS